MNRRLFKVALVLLAMALLVGAGFLQSTLNRERAVLGLTRREPLENAPPVLALTTQALGGFRGLIANALWVRATKLQDDGKYFEMVQLADWITKLEPHFVHVWLVQGWNMAYNISVKFSNHADRWRWVQRGIELLRDDGLRYNPKEALIYRELAWFFQHKMGQNLDDAHFYYKLAWADEMTRVFGGEKPSFERLINPQTPDEAQRARVLRERYKLDPERMRSLDERYGPLDWRLPEAHAIYWAALGLEKANPDQLMTLRRVIYQSMKLSFDRGRLVLNTNLPPSLRVRLLPNLEIAPKVNAAYLEQFPAVAPHETNALAIAYRAFLREAPYQFFINNRTEEARQWMRLLRERYPGDVPADVSLAEYAIARATGNVREQTQVKVTSLMYAFVGQSYLALLEGREDDANQYIQRAHELYESYQKSSRGDQRIAIPTVDEVKRAVIESLLDPERGLQPEARDRLRRLLALPPETAPEAPAAKP